MRDFLINSKNPEYSSMIWNAIANIVMAFQSVIILIVISNTYGLGVEAVGIYVIGNSLNNLFLCIGKYGVRNYQVSDVKYEYDFVTYLFARRVSVLVMAIISIIYTLIARTINDYSFEKTIIILFMCIYKLPDAYEDVYYGEYQRNDRLDVASKATAIRLIINIALWSILLLVTQNMIISVVITTITTIIIMFWFVYLTKNCINITDLSQSTSKASVKKLLYVTFPLALSSFLAIYIGTAPRISIDGLLDDKSQGIYGYIAMPVFVVQILLMFVLNPKLEMISELFVSDIKAYKKECIKQFLFVFIMTVICMIGAFVCGIPVLSMIYSEDLSLYKTDLLIMMVSSGLLALSTLLQVLLTIMRKQNIILIGYIIVAIIALLFSNLAIRLYGIRGAVIFYLVLLLVLCIIYFLSYIFFIEKKKSFIID